KAVRDPGGAIWTYTYDMIGNRLTASDPDLGQWSYVYDNAERLISQTDARGAVTSLVYDQLGRLLTKSVKGPGEPTWTVLSANTYDDAPSGVGSGPYYNVGLLTKATKDGVTSSFSRTLTGTETVLTTKTSIAGVDHTSVEIKSAADQTLSQSYSTASIAVGDRGSPWAYSTNNQLQVIPGYITATSYEADGKTRSIAYFNGVTT
ncbi:RHS repeat domain-containing protein, partial [Xaviernesmea oryzae]|uniref:RHS repeat domain-containing protein n=1 Tax=Xaviernesmea oryzae TaxID=464029 RepID=UPI000A56C522